MFERFTEEARQVVVLAQEEARTLKHNYIGTEHILLGILREEEGLGARVLESLGVTLDRVREQVVQIVGAGDETTAGQIPFTPRAKKVLELSLREALSLGHNHIGPEHILLGLVRENEGVATRILLTFDADAETIRTEVIRQLSGPGARQYRDSPDRRRLTRTSSAAPPVRPQPRSTRVARRSRRGTRRDSPTTFAPSLGGNRTPAICCMCWRRAPTRSRRMPCNGSESTSTSCECTLTSVREESAEQRRERVRALRERLGLPGTPDEPPQSEPPESAQ